MVARALKKLFLDRTAEYESFLKKVSQLYKIGLDYEIRHDVDTDPEAALILGKILSKYGNGSFYFRWSTMNPKIMRELRNLGHEVSLHYETFAKEIGLFNRLQTITQEHIKDAKSKLDEEIDLFESLFWDINTITAHGSIINRRIGIPNTVVKHPRDVSDLPHDTDRLEISVHRRTLIHPEKYINPNKIRRIMRDIKDKIK